MNQTENQWLENIYRREVDTIYRICLALTGAPADAEDALQSVFLKLLEHGQSFVSEEHEKAWLIRVAKNHCLDLRRQWWRRRVTGLDQIAEISVQDHQQEREVFLQLLELPPRHRLVLYLYYYEGYSVAEIGKILRCSTNTVKTRLRAARMRLKLEIGEEER